ncbi:MAG: hypothetical protein AB7S26_36545 [Sandaracinaceae bacterium]
MERRREPARQSYRTRPDGLPLDVITVRPGEYAEPPWLRGLRRRVRRILGRLARVR